MLASAAAAARRRACSLLASSSSSCSSSLSLEASSSASSSSFTSPSMAALFSSSPLSRAADPPAARPASPASRAPATSSDLARDTPYGPGPSANSVASRETTRPGQAFVGDLRGASALGLGDGITDHTAKWMQTDGPLNGNSKPPMDWIADSEPIEVHGAVVASTGGEEDPALGCPVEFIDLRGTSRESPAVCKYSGLKFYSRDWHHAH